LLLMVGLNRVALPHLDDKNGLVVWGGLRRWDDKNKSISTVEYVRWNVGSLFFVGGEN